MKNVKKHLKYMFLIVKYSLMKEFAYRLDFFLSFFSSTIWNIGALLFLKFTLDQVDSIAGFDFYDLVFLHAIGQVWAYIYFFASYPSFKHFNDFINDGELDFLLLRPLNSQLTATFRETDYSSLFALIQPVAMIIYVLSNKSYDITIWSVLIFLCSITMTALIIHLLETSLTTFTFWFVKSEIGSLYFATEDISHYPYEIFKSKALKLVFFTIMPYALSINVPFRTLINIVDYRLLILQVFVLIFFIFLSRFLWKLGLKKYQGVSS